MGGFVSHCAAETKRVEIFFISNANPKPSKKRKEKNKTK